MKEKAYNIVGFLLTLPALVLIFTGVLFSIFDSPQIEKLLNPELFIFHPAIIVGGLVVSMVANLGIILKRKRLILFNFSIALLDFLLLSAIFLYLIAENTEIFSPLF